MIEAARVRAFVVTAVEDCLQIEHDIGVALGQGDGRESAVMVGAM
jgi:hypothetical protein